MIAGKWWPVIDEGSPHDSTLYGNYMLTDDRTAANLLDRAAESATQVQPTKMQVQGMLPTT